MMNITKENNFSETAFTVRETDGYGLRWFTPGGEISLCGHATLATAYVLFRFYEKSEKSEKSAEKIVFHTMSGDLFIDHDEDYIVMDFPAYQLNPVAVSDQMEEAFGIRPSEAYIDRDLLLVFDNEEQVRALQPDFEKMKLLPGEGVGVTARGKEYDCVSRFFDPKLKVNEDPVTGSAHCMIAPYWAGRLHKNDIFAYQASARGGEMRCNLNGNRVLIAGKAVLFSESELNI